MSVNKKMKDLNKILYDILLKIDTKRNVNDNFQIDHKIILKYFDPKNEFSEENIKKMANYFNNFFNFCFDLSLNNMIKEASNFGKNYGSS